MTNENEKNLSKILYVGLELPIIMEMTKHPYMDKSFN